MMRVAGGKLIEGWDDYDHAALLSALGSPMLSARAGSPRSR